MADGTNGDPVILDPAYRFAVKLLTSLFSHDDAALVEVTSRK
jgi:hypothetical protein